MQRPPDAPSAAQARVLAAAVRLFARHGVGGTSLQMIADEIGVTKAAVYHQYRTKDEIVRAVATAELAGVEAVLDTAEAEPTATEARAAAIRGIVDLAVERRRQTAPILNDPVVSRLFGKDKRLHRVMDRLNLLLMGPDAGPDSHVATAMLTAAISGAVMHPLVANCDDETLRTQLSYLARRFLGLSVNA
jgi:AcrR family transcriptional regulator